MSNVAMWPALEGFDPDTDLAIPYEFAAWGKVHGQPSDYRWIAKTPDFTSPAPRVGIEDFPRDSCYWSVQGDWWVAMRVQQSTAVDQAGRGELIEKQLASVRRDSDLPGALVSSVLLAAEIYKPSDAWQQHSADRRWSRADFYLPLAQREPLQMGGTLVDKVLARALDVLRGLLDERQLAECYHRLLEPQGDGPVCITGLAKPLPPQALGALLLPLPRGRADALSVAGWLLSDQYRASLMDAWQLVVMPPRTRGAREASPVEPSTLACTMARSVFTGDPSGLTASTSSSSSVGTQGSSGTGSEDGEAWVPVDEQRALPAPSAAWPEAIHQLHAFAQAERRRWFDPDRARADLKRRGAATANLPWRPANAEQSALILSWIDTLRSAPPHYADPEQWQVKLAVLASARFALFPSKETLRALQEDLFPRVPALLFCPLVWASSAQLRQQLAESERRLVTKHLKSMFDLHQPLMARLKAFQHWS